MKRAIVLGLVGLSILMTVGCDKRITEERRADALELRLKRNLELEQRRAAARQRMKAMQAAYDAKVAELRTN